MEDLIKRIDALDDQKAIRVLEFYSTRIFEGMEISPQELLNGIPQDFKDRVAFEQVLELSPKELARPLPGTESVELARALLKYFAKDPAFMPSLVEALDEYKDDKLFVGTILATGVAASMIIIASSTTFNGKVGNIEITKSTVNIGDVAKLVEALGKLFPKLA